VLAERSYPARQTGTLATDQVAVGVVLTLACLVAVCTVLAFLALCAPTNHSVGHLPLTSINYLSSSWGKSLSSRPRPRDQDLQSNLYLLSYCTSDLRVCSHGCKLHFMFTAHTYICTECVLLCKCHIVEMSDNVCRLTSVIWFKMAMTDRGLQAETADINPHVLLH